MKIPNLGILPLNQGFRVDVVTEVLVLLRGRTNYILDQEQNVVKVHVGSQRVLLAHPVDNTLDFLVVFRQGANLNPLY